MAPSVFNIPLHRSFADALAAGLIARFGRERTGLASGFVLVPNNRAGRAIQEAFVRRSGGGLLLPRLVPIGDPELDERIGGLLEPIAAAESLPPAIGPLQRRMLLARLVQRHRAVGAAEALRLADELGRTLDQLRVEEVEPARLASFAASHPDLATHWQVSLDQLRLILEEWPAWLRAHGRIDLTERRNRVLDAVGRRWRQSPPAFACAAGVTTAAPAVARLMRTVASLPAGMVVLPGLDLDLPDDEWEALGPTKPGAGPVGAGGPKRLETHPQFHLKLLLDRIGVAREEVQVWRAGGGRGTPAARGRAIAHAMAPAAFTEKWQHLASAERRLTGVRALEVADPAEEAQAIAIALREALEKPGRTAALVTPDRALAGRVSAHLRRWGIEADDSAGGPLSRTPTGTLLLAMARASAERFAPVSLLALLKHPLVMAGDDRLAWLDGARLLDLALRGPRPPAGLDGVSRHLAERSGRDARVREQAERWWRKVEPRLRALETDPADLSLTARLEALRDAIGALGGDGAWSGSSGRAAAEFFTELEATAADGPETVTAADLPVILERLLETQAVRPLYGRHPRIFIWGLLEARLQHADLMILAGLNEGVWPALPAPDPWLAPRIRAELGLPSLERRIGLAAHDLALALGAPRVLVTRARRDARAPAIASRFWLRLEAMTGGLARMPDLDEYARAIDRPVAHEPTARPAPAPASANRPIDISVTEVDRLKADPFAFYARRILRLSALEAVDSDPTAAWRGSAVHAVLEVWMKEDECDPDRLALRAEALFAKTEAHPMMRALWQPRLMEAIAFVAKQVATNRSNGRRPLVAEAKGACDVAGVRLKGVADRIDRLADGTLAILDYKTGQPPSARAVEEGFSLQLGLLGLIAERGGFEGVSGTPSCFEYWSLARKRGRFGFVESPLGGRSRISTENFVAHAAHHFAESAGRWLTGSEPFTAKLHPEYSPYGEYDQLMRRDEWYGRESDGGLQASARQTP